VHDSQYCTKLAEIANAAIVGPGLQQGTQLGPVLNRMQYDKLKVLIEETKSHGSIIAGRDSPDEPRYFINPTIVRDLPDDARLVTEEQFGPVLPVMCYADVSDVIARQQHQLRPSQFGLVIKCRKSGGGVSGACRPQLMRLARRERLWGVASSTA
jgi:acyl-CoA reductase-like NAD-dependent aldehyde dehydrogenase